MSATTMPGMNHRDARVVIVAHSAISATIRAPTQNETSGYNEINLIIRHHLLLKSPIPSARRFLLCFDVDCLKYYNTAQTERQYIFSEKYKMF
jgi:hypothetical protein